jgi:hypothetical protein
MSFDLGFWYEENPITAEEAGVIYMRLCEGDVSVVKAYPITYFLEDVKQHYPPIGAYRDEDVDDCPWNCDWDIGPGSVVVCIAWSRADELTPILMELANEHDLLCYNPQRGEVYLPASLLNDKN